MKKLMIELFKEVNSDVQELIILDSLIEVFKSIIWSSGKWGPIKKESFLHKNLLTQVLTQQWLSCILQMNTIIHK